MVQAYSYDIPPSSHGSSWHWVNTRTTLNPYRYCRLLHWVPWSRPTPTTPLPSYHGSSWDWVNMWMTHNPSRSVVVSYTECRGAGLPLRHPSPHPRVAMGLSQHVDDPQPIQVCRLLHWVPWCRPTPTTSLPSSPGSSWDWVNTWMTPNPSRLVVSYTECRGAGLPLRHPSPHPPGRHGTQSTRGWPSTHPG